MHCTLTTLYVSPLLRMIGSRVVTMIKGHHIEQYNGKENRDLWTQSKRTLPETDRSCVTWNIHAPDAWQHWTNYKSIVALSMSMLLIVYFTMVSILHTYLFVLRLSFLSTTSPRASCCGLWLWCERLLHYFQLFYYWRRRCYLLLMLCRWPRFILWDSSY